jgi:hypothetical protein
VNLLWLSYHEYEWKCIRNRKMFMHFYGKIMLLNFVLFFDLVSCAWVQELVQIRNNGNNNLSSTLPVVEVSSIIDPKGWIGLLSGLWSWINIHNSLQFLPGKLSWHYCMHLKWQNKRVVASPTREFSVKSQEHQEINAQMHIFDMIFIIFSCWAGCLFCCLFISGNYFYAYLYLTFPFPYYVVHRVVSSSLALM